MLKKTWSERTAIAFWHLILQTCLSCPLILVLQEAWGTDFRFEPVTSEKPPNVWWEITDKRFNFHRKVNWNLSSGVLVGSSEEDRHSLGAADDSAAKRCDLTAFSLVLIVEGFFFFKGRLTLTAFYWHVYRWNAGKRLHLELIAEPSVSTVPVLFN